MASLGSAHRPARSFGTGANVRGGLAASLALESRRSRFAGVEGRGCGKHLQSASIRDSVGDAERPVDRLRAGERKGDGKNREEKKKEAEEKKEENKEKKEEAKDEAKDKVEDKDNVVDTPGTDRSQDRRQDRRRDAVK